MSGALGHLNDGLRRSLVLRGLALTAAVILMPACELMVEWDYLGDGAPKKSTTYGGGLGSADIENIFEEVGFDEVDVRIDPVDTAVSGNVSCVSYDYLDANFAKFEDRRPGFVEKAWCWYAHGLMVDGICTDMKNGIKAAGYEGALWFPQGRRTREKFLVIREMVGTDSDMHVRVAVHELAHVLNLHHCDLNADRVDQYPTGFKETSSRRCFDHMTDHKDSHESYVKPGPTGEPFCGAQLNMPTKHTTVHDEEMTAGTSECAVSDCATLSALLKATSLSGLRLTLEPEKSQFAPGEPILLRAVLDTGEVPNPGMFYRGELSLDPQLGYLRLWAGTSEDDLRPIHTPMLLDAALEPTPFPGRVEVSGLDAWYLLPFDLKSTQQTLYAQATFTEGDQVARTDIIEVAINRQPPSGPPSSGVLEMFTHPESRRFLYFQGGDHLEQGRDMLDQVASAAFETVYGTYADLALGVSLSAPFQMYDRKERKHVTRAADPAAAREHLDRAELFRQQLPPTRRRSLAQVRGLVYEALGDLEVPTNPQAAIPLYREALENFGKLDALPRPTMMPRVDYDAKIDEQVERVRAKLRQLPDPQ